MVLTVSATKDGAFVMLDIKELGVKILMSVMTSSVFGALVGMECAFVIEDTADYNVKLLTDAMAAIAVYMVCVVLECAFVITVTKVTRARYRVARLLRQTPRLLSSLALQQELLYCWVS